MSIAPKNPPAPPPSPPPPPPTVVVRTGKGGSGTKLCCSCSCAALAILGLILLWVLWLVAATGIASIPLISRLAYRTPEPLRGVQAEQALKLPFDPAALGSLQNFDLKEGEEPTPEQLEQFEQLFNEDALGDLVAQLDQLGGSVRGSRFQFEITEGMLTGSMQGVGAASSAASRETADALFDFSKSQVAVSKTKGLEVFLPLVRNDQRSALRMYLVPSALENGAIDLDLTDIWLGNLRFPGWFTGPFNEGLLRKAVEALSPELLKYMRVESLNIQDGSVTLEGELTQAFQAL